MPKIKCPNCRKLVDRDSGWCPDCAHRIIGSVESEMLIDHGGVPGLKYPNLAEKQKAEKNRKQEEWVQRVWIVIIVGGLIWGFMYLRQDKRTDLEKYWDARCNLELEAATSGNIIDERKMSKECVEYDRQRQYDAELESQEADYYDPYP